MVSILEESKKSRGAGKFVITKKRIGIFIFTIFILAFTYHFFLSKEDSEKKVVLQKEWTVKKSDLKISIESDGKVVAEDGVELSFPVSGNNLEIEDVFVKEGDKIAKGDKIATVKTETLELNVRSSYSNYLSTLADYNEIMNGATDKQIAEAKDHIASAELSLNQSKISLANTKQSVKDSIQEADDKVYDVKRELDDAEEKLNDNRSFLSSKDVGDAYDALVDTLKSVNISLGGFLKDSDEILGIDNKILNDKYEEYIAAKDISTLNNAKSSYRQAKTMQRKLDSQMIGLDFNSNYKKIDQLAKLCNDTLTEFEKHFYAMEQALDTSITSASFTQNTLDGLINKISNNRVSINTKITSVNNKIKGVDDAQDNLNDYVNDYDDAKRDLANAKIDLENAKTEATRNVENSEANLASRKLNLTETRRNYDDLLAPLTASEIASAKSRLTSASVNLEKSKNELENATIISPIDGEIARLNYKTGDIIVDNSSSLPVAIIINNDTLFIEVNIEEADISKIKRGQTVYATFEALDDLKLEGTVTFIALTSKTNNSGIVTYMVRIIIKNKEGSQIKEGMTASVDFVTAEAKDVLAIPVSAVKNVKNSPSVMDNNGKWISVVTGFTDGKNVEVIKGLSVGDKILY